MATGDWQRQTHIGILLVDAGDGETRPALLIVLIGDEWIGVDVAMDDLEAIFVCDAVAVPECGGWVDKTGHVMEKLTGISGE